jgi:hypothetical protein
MLKPINSLKNKEYASLKKQFIFLSNFYIYIYIYLLVYYLRVFSVKIVLFIIEDKS